jgi:hypothetical protein
MKKYFHVSKKHLGDSPVFLPRVPESSLSSIEGDIPRVCVSELLFFCLRGITGQSPLRIVDLLSEFVDGREGFEPCSEFIKRGGKLLYPSVYSTTEIPHLPPKASDFRANKEMWFIYPVQMKLEGYLDLKWLVEHQKLKITSDAGSLPASYLEIANVVIEKQKHLC